MLRAVQVMDIPMLKDFINALVMDSLTYGGWIYGLITLSHLISYCIISSHLICYDMICRDMI